ncbi:MAG: DUF1028 domain-containing protein [Gemmatimonadota bacterium]|nr:DUF1028 domain-containing protein [Gemmatimonadota bacterium]MDH5758529.1 DUF1028 domain-containing protein [Gemmatimonadota bacterium]
MPSSVGSLPGRRATGLAVLPLASLLLSVPAVGTAQEPASWGADVLFHTFSIAAVDPETGESGVAVTTRVACVGNGVPWVRAGVGAVATQASTRMEYGEELLDLLASGVTPEEALKRRIAADDGRERRQVGVIALDGSGAQHTGSETVPWAGHRSGATFVTQGNMLVGPEVVEAVARTFQASEGSHRHLADRLIEALAAGQAQGGDARKGRLQSAAVIVADPRPGMARRADGVAVNINVCEHPTPVAELRRIYGVVSQTLGYRTLQQEEGYDVVQLKIILRALGYLPTPADTSATSAASDRFDSETVDAVDRFRTDRGLSTPAMGTPPGLVDEETVRHLWEAVEQAGMTAEVRTSILDGTRIRR